MWDPAAYSVTKNICVLYVMVNLIKVKRISIDVVVTLVMCEKKHLSLHSQICWTRIGGLSKLHSIWRCVSFSWQPRRGISGAEIDWTHGSIIILEIAIWKIRSVGGLSIVLSLEPTRISANFWPWVVSIDQKSNLQTVPAIVKYWLEFKKSI